MITVPPYQLKLDALRLAVDLASAHGGAPQFIHEWVEYFERELEKALED